MMRKITALSGWRMNGLPMMNHSTECSDIKLRLKNARSAGIFCLRIKKAASFFREAAFAAKKYYLEEEAEELLITVLGSRATISVLGFQFAA